MSPPEESKTATTAESETANDTKTTPAEKKTCNVCGKDATKFCSRCKLVYYCCVEHQKSDWKKHKKTCLTPSQRQDQYQADQYTMHKSEFDRIIKKYKLDTEEKSTEIANYLTNISTSSNSGGDDDGKVSAPDFANKFGTTIDEAVIFLEWIKVGVKFKEQSIDTAKKAGLG